MHIAKVCKSRIIQSSQSKAPDTEDSNKVNHQVTQGSYYTVSCEYTLFTLPYQQTKPLQTDIEIEGYNLSMEIDTGAAVSIVSDRMHTSLPYLEKLPLQLTQVTLQTYTGESIPVLGELSVKVICQGTNHTLLLLAVKEDGPSFISRNWLTNIQLDWKNILQSLENGN